MDKKFVFPGEHLVSEEEFSPKANAYSSEGEVYAQAAGMTAFDTKNRTVSVQAMKEVSSLKDNDIVLARVTFKRKNMAAVEIFLVESANGKRVVITRRQAAILIREVSTGYIKDINDEFRIGDIVRAKVSMVKKFAINLKTNEPELGVIRAKCGTCKNDLFLQGNNLTCSECGTIEKRKLSTKYVI